MNECNLDCLFLYDYFYRFCALVIHCLRVHDARVGSNSQQTKFIMSLSADNAQCPCTLHKSIRYSSAWSAVSRAPHATWKNLRNCTLTHDIRAVEAKKRPNTAHTMENKLKMFETESSVFGPVPTEVVAIHFPLSRLLAHQFSH